MHGPINIKSVVVVYHTTYSVYLIYDIFILSSHPAWTTAGHHMGI